MLDNKIQQDFTIKQATTALGFHSYLYRQRRNGDYYEKQIKTHIEHTPYVQPIAFHRSYVCFGGGDRI